MKKFCVLLLVLASFHVYAANKNQSVEYTRMLNRNASTSVDASYYNPAGLSFLSKDGFHFQVSNQVILQTKTIEDKSDAIKTYGEKEYEGKVNAYLFPDIHAAYKAGDLSFFFNAMPIGGGGGGVYNDGLPQFEEMIIGTVMAVQQQTAAGAIAQGLSPEQAAALTAVTSIERDVKFEGSVYVIGTTIGAAYKINDIMSVALGYRLNYGYQHYSGHAKDVSTDNATINQNLPLGWKDVKVDTTATGFGNTFILGYNVKPISNLNVGVRGEYSTKMELEYDGKTIEGSDSVKEKLDDIYGKGEKVDVTEPISLSLGLAYNVLPSLLIVADFNYIFYSQLDLPGDLEKYKKDMIFTGLGAEYTINSNFAVSTGYAYDSGSNEGEAMSETDFGLAVHHLAIGGKYMPSANLSIEMGYIHSFYLEGTRVGADAIASQVSGTSQTKKQTVNQTSSDFCFGMNYSL